MNIMKKISDLLKAAWFFVTFQTKKLSAKENVMAAITIVNAIKQVTDWTVTSWLVTLTNTKLDDRILEIAKQRIPKILTTLQMLQELSDNPTAGQVELLLQSFTGIIINDPKERERLLTSLGAMLIIALEDGVVTFGEASAIIEKYYQETQK